MKIIYGPAGTGKTKALIDLANEQLKKAKGNIVFLSYDKKCSIDLNIDVRFVDVTEFNIQGEDGFRGFIKGIVAANGDNEYIFIDGIARITGRTIENLDNIFGAMEKLEKDFGVKFAITCSGKKEDLPEFVTKYID